ncbi:MAG: DUF3122 domain-containing protein [Cyanobacteria bacterium P01_F01_bin.13]
MKRSMNSDSHPSLSQIITKFFFILGLTLLLIVLWSAPVALAKVQFLKEADRWIYQSQQMLTDTQGNLWEITVLKPMEQDSKGVYLWLTTQANEIYLDAAQPLIVKTNSGQKLSAPNLTQQYFVGELPDPQVGRYDIEMLLANIKDKQSLQLELSTKTNTPISLVIPAKVLDEWLNVGTCEYLICMGSQ